MRLFILILLVIPFFLSAQTKELETISKRIKKSKIKSVTDYLFFLNNPGIDSFKVQTKYFDRSGNDTLVEFYSITNHEVFSKNVKKYDKFGRMIKKIDLKTTTALIKRNKDKNIPTKTGNKNQNVFVIELISEFEYNKKGHTARKIEKDADGNIINFYSFEYKYNNAGKILETKTKCSNEMENRREVYTYDTKGNRLSLLNYDYKDSLLYIIKYEYDSAGNQVFMASYNFNGAIKEKFISKFDNKGNRIERVNYDSNSVAISKSVIKYDENNRPIEISRIPYTSELEFLRSTTTFDANGNILVNIRYDQDNKPYRMQKYIYTFYKK